MRSTYNKALCNIGTVLWFQSEQKYSLMILIRPSLFLAMIHSEPPVLHFIKSHMTFTYIFSFTNWDFSRFLSLFSLMMVNALNVCSMYAINVQCMQ